MKNLRLVLLLSFAFASLLNHAAAQLASVPFTTSRAQFASGDSITIQEVLATSPRLETGDTVTVRGTYTLQSQPAAILGVSLTTTGPSGPTPVSPAARKSITAGSGTFDLTYEIRAAGSLHISFSPTTSGSSFGTIYFAASAGGGGGTTTPPPVASDGLTAVPFGTYNARFATSDSVTIREVLSTSPAMEAGDRVVVRGDYRLQSRTAAVLMMSLTVNTPGARVPVAASSRKSIDAGTGTFELEYNVQQPGSLHVSLYPAEGGSSFGGVYFASPGAIAQRTATLNRPASNTGLLTNLSTRGVVAPGEGALVSGLNVADHDRYVVIRAIGPTLSSFGVTGVLRRPVVSVYRGSELIATGASWATGFSVEQRNALDMLMRSVGAFPLANNAEDSVLHLRLTPGTYSITVSPGDNQSGIALLEVYASDTFTLPVAP